jgi:hypothetical protein
MYTINQHYIMEVVALMKYIIIAALILAGYYVVSSSAFKPRSREGFSAGSSDTPPVTAKKSSDVLTDSAKSMIGVLQISNNRITYETLVEVVDAWTQGKIVASMNALSEQMIADSSSQADMTSPPSEKTVALMNSLITMTNFQTTVVPAALKFLDAAN